jgi:hypothetical protein
MRVLASSAARAAASLFPARRGTVPAVGWPEIQGAILDAVALASGVDRSRVRLSGDAHPAARVLVADVDLELRQVDWEQRSLGAVEGGVEEVLRVELEIVARVSVWSLTHDATAGAYGAAYRALRRSHLSVVRDVLHAAGVVLRQVERAVPARVKFDDHVETVVTWSWILHERSDEAEGAAPGGAAPRPFVEVVAGPALGATDARAAVTPALPPAALRLGWRSLWMGGAHDRAGGRELAGAGVAHDQAAADLPVPLDRASALSAGGEAACSDPDAGQLREGAVLVAFLRAPAGGDGVVLARGADWALRLEGDEWVLAVLGSDVGSAPATGDWDLLVLGAAGGELGVWRAGGATTSAGDPPAPGQVPLALGSGTAPAGTLCALLGELPADDPAQARADVADALGVA